MSYSPCLGCPDPGDPGAPTGRDNVGFSAPDEISPLRLPNVDRGLKLGDFVRVYVLGEGAEGTVIEQFAGQTGYHIRTIPQERFTNPVMVAAGAGYLAVVDRGDEFDTIRITDQYGGAGAEAFDDNGFPSSEIDWTAVADIKTFAVSGFLSGLQILPRGTLVGTINAGNGIPTFIKGDVDGDFESYNGEFTLPAPYDTLGDAVGVPCPVDQSQGSRMHEFLALVRNDEEGSAIVKVDFATGEVKGLLGLPEGQPYGVSHTGGVASIMMGDANGITHVYRVAGLNDSNFMSYLRWADSVPKAEEPTAISETFVPLDVQGQELDDYYGIALDANHEFQAPFSSREETVADPAVLEGGRPITPTTTVAKNDDRVSEDGTYTTQHYGGEDGVEIPAQIITNPSGDDLPSITDLDSVENTVGELLVYDRSQLESIEDPLFRLVHGTHYDYLSDGGFVFDCADPDSDVPIPVNSELRPLSIAIDRATEPGSLKPLVDLKVALVDKLNGRFVYPDIKSKGYKFYGGNMAGIKIAPSPDAAPNPNSEGVFDPELRANPAVRKTPCTARERARMEDYDGIHVEDTSAGQITELEPEGAAALTANDSHRPWNLHIPRVIDGTLYLHPYRTLPVLTQGRPTWEGVLASPIAAAITLNAMTFPKKGSDTPDQSFSVSGANSGFFGLNWATNIGTDEIESIDLTPARITANTETVPAITPVPPEAVLAPIDGLEEYPELVRGVVFNTPIRTWVNISADLLAGIRPPAGVAFTVNDLEQIYIIGSSFLGGYAVTEYPAERYYNDDLSFSLPWLWWVPFRIGSTLTVGPGEYVGYSRATGIAHYYGDKAASAVGVWVIDVLADGVPIDSVATRVTSESEITSLAPSEMQSILSASLQTDNITNGFVGRVYYSASAISQITVRARLFNHALNIVRKYYVKHYNVIGVYSAPGGNPADFIEFRAQIDSNPEGIYEPGDYSGVCADTFADAAGSSVSPWSLYPNCMETDAFTGRPTAAEISYIQSWAANERDLLNSTGPYAQPEFNRKIWDGRATFTVSANPYADDNLSVGVFFNATLNFNLNGPMSGWDFKVTGDPPDGDTEYQGGGLP